MLFGLKETGVCHTTDCTVSYNFIQVESSTFHKTSNSIIAISYSIWILPLTIDQVWQHFSLFLLEIISIYLSFVFSYLVVLRVHLRGCEVVRICCKVISWVLYSSRNVCLCIVEIATDWTIPSDARIHCAIRPLNIN